MTDPNQEQSIARAYGQPDVDLGGADNVQKTTYVRGAGTEPDQFSMGPIAAVPSPGAPSTLIALLILIAIGAAIVYLVALGG